VMLAQTPTLVQLAGAGMILAGVVVATRIPAKKSSTTVVGKRMETSV